MSKEFKGTQGQWILSPNQEKFIANSDDKFAIAKVFKNFMISGSEQKANAKLIVKAPEMLEALQFFVNNNMLSVIGEEVAERLINEILE